MKRALTAKLLVGSIVGLVVSQFLAPVVPPVATAQDAPAPAKNEFTLYHVVGAAAEEISVPPALESLRKSLVSKTNRKAFQLLGTPASLTLSVGKSATVPIPNKLGKIQLTLDAEGKIEVVMFGADDKRQGAIASRVFPVVWLNDKIKTQKGDYILVLDRKKDES
ncbi:MAG: hypothetical protein AB7O52_15015 [Planctomycetota bacterium]